MSSIAGIGLDQSTVEAAREVGRWRTDMLDRLLRWVFALGAIVAVPSIVLAVRTDLPVVAVIDVLALGALAVITFGRGISFPVRAGGLIVLVYGLGVALLWSVRVDREVVDDVPPGDECVSVLTVSDTGRGIDPADLDRVFDPFFTTKAPGEGSGLGLASVHGIVSSLGGSMSVQSRPGRGATFRIELPESAPASTPAPVPTDVAAVLADGRPAASGSRCVLLVEDDPAIRALSSAWLARQGHEVVTAVDGADAVEVFDVDPDRVDVLVTDVAMPRLDGPALVRHVRARRPELPVVVTSGFGEAEVAEALAVAGDEVAVVRLPKPYSLDELLTAVTPPV